MSRGPSFIVSNMQEETTPIFKRLWYDWTQQQPGIEPTNPLGQCWVLPIIAFYDQQGLLRTYSLQGDPHGLLSLSFVCAWWWWWGGGGLAGLADPKIDVIYDSFRLF